ncbi:unnamed protein product [Camellia sinensis]
MRMIFGKRYYSEELENYEEAKQFRDLVSETFEYDSASNPNDFLLVLRWIDYGNFDKNLGRIHKRMDALLQGLIDEHRSDKSRNSMIDHLLSLQESQPEYYTDEIIRRLILMVSPEHAGVSPEHAGVSPAKTAVINGGNDWALAAVLLPPLKVDINGDFFNGGNKIAVNDTFNDGFRYHR